MPSNTNNIYQEKINQVIDYVNANLHTPIKLDILASQIHVSQRHLLRIMRLSINESLHSYITRQRIERAVLYMQIEKLTLTKLAEMVGYDNPQSLSKAFKKQLGISPKTYMYKLQSKLVNYAKNYEGFKKSIPSEICEEEDLDLVYIRIIGKYGEKNIYDTAWNKLIDFLKKEEAILKETRYIGISFDDPNITQSKHCRFYACASVRKTMIPKGEFGTIKLKKGKYAAYMLQGSHSKLQKFYNVLSVNFEHNIRYGTSFEEYISYSEENCNENITKVYIPIK